MVIFLQVAKSLTSGLFIIFVSLFQFQVMQHLLVFLVVRAHIPKMNLDEVFEQKNEVAQAVSEELEKVLVFA